AGRPPGTRQAAAGGARDGLRGGGTPVGERGFEGRPARVRAEAQAALDGALSPGASTGANGYCCRRTLPALGCETCTRGGSVNATDGASSCGGRWPASGVSVPSCSARVREGTCTRGATSTSWW